MDWFFFCCLFLFKREYLCKLNVIFIWCHNVVHFCTPEEPAPLQDAKTKAVDEMMERIKKGIVLKPMKRMQVQEIQCLNSAFISKCFNCSILIVLYSSCRTMTTGWRVSLNFLTMMLIKNCGAFYSQSNKTQNPPIGLKGWKEEISHPGVERNAGNATHCSVV